MLQKRPIYVTKETHNVIKETHICYKRDPYMLKKRPIYVTKETHMCRNRDLHISQRGPRMYNLIKGLQHTSCIRPIHTYVSSDFKRDLYMLQKRSIYVAKETHSKQHTSQLFVSKETYECCKRDPYIWHMSLSLGVSLRRP